MTLYDELITFSRASFRDFYKKFIYIECRELLDEMFPKELDDSITGLIAYCYIDRTEGLSFRPIMMASLDAETLEVRDFPNADNTIYILRLRDEAIKMSEMHEGDAHMYLYSIDPVNYEFFDLSAVDFDMEAFAEIKDQIDTVYDAGDEVETLRSEKYNYLDKYRNDMFPDDVQALLISEEKGIEQVWVRLSFVSKRDGIFGELLNEPHNDYGCHEGMLIGIKELQTADNKYLVFNGLIADEL